MTMTPPTTDTAHRSATLLHDIAHIVQRVVPRDDWERAVLERFMHAVSSTASQYPTSPYRG